ncbi:MAG: RNA polymerase sigma factor [Bacteroidia bacterium]|nr:RNA polymerase sigma factor [Bacteroidia bacterium]
MVSPEDQQLISASLKGDRVGQSRLYKKYAQAMFNTAIRMVSEREIAKDLTQDVFVKVFQDLGRFRQESTLGAWIKRITVNTCLNHLKKAGRMQFQEVEVEKLKMHDMADEESKTPDMKIVHKAIKGLPNGCRTVLNLYLLEGYQHKEIADILSIKESTSKTQYRRAKQLLQDQLKSQLYAT